MTVDVTWLVEAAVIEQTMNGNLTPAQILEGATISAEMLGQSEKPLVHVLINASNDVSFPNNLAKIAEAFKPMFDHDRLGWTVIYGLDGQVLNFITSTAAQLYSVRFRAFDSREESVGHLQFVDSTLPEIS